MACNSGDPESLNMCVPNYVNRAGANVKLGYETAGVDIDYYCGDELWVRFYPYFLTNS